MLPNKLYRFIKNVLSQPSVAATNPKFKFLINVEQQQFVIYELPVVKSFLMDELNVQHYNLLSHHVSFYEFQDKK